MHSSALGNLHTLRLEWTARFTNTKKFWRCHKVGLNVHLCQKYNFHEFKPGFIHQLANFLLLSKWTMENGKEANECITQPNPEHVAKDENEWVDRKAHQHAMHHPADYALIVMHHVIVFLNANIVSISFMTITFTTLLHCLKYSLHSFMQ